MPLLGVSPSAPSRPARPWAGGGGGGALSKYWRFLAALPLAPGTPPPPTPQSGLAGASLWGAELVHPAVLSQIKITLRFRVCQGLGLRGSECFKGREGPFGKMKSSGDEGGDGWHVGGAHHGRRCRDGMGCAGLCEEPRPQGGRTVSNQMPVLIARAG